VTIPAPGLDDDDDVDVVDVVVVVEIVGPDARPGFVNNELICVSKPLSTKPKLIRALVSGSGPSLPVSKLRPEVDRFDGFQVFLRRRPIPSTTFFKKKLFQSNIYLKFTI
jgi:hypothetical protein